MIALFVPLWGPGWWSPSSAADTDVSADAAEEVVVWGDLFARWDDTRWMVTTELGLPYALVLAKDENAEFDAQELQLRTVIACSKEWKLGRHKFEVACRIEDFAIQAAIGERRVSPEDIARAQSVLDEIDAKLTGAALSLQVADDGRVTNLDLEGVPSSNRRQTEIHETLRQVMSRVIVGFNLKLRKFNQLNEGKWYEYNSTLMSMPVPPSIPATQGSNMVVHYLNPYQGQLVVQSIGKGLVAVQDVNYTIDLIGVSIFDKDEGFMLERVWAIDGTTTASALFSSNGYFNAGRIWVLGKDTKPDCGPTQVVNGRGQSVEGLPKWVPIER
ncbi:MAG: hypothetical protein ABMB14_02955 [Myxococcota bacterium]